MKKHIFYSIICIMMASFAVSAEEVSESIENHANDNIPAGLVMASSVMKKGETMLSYQYSNMEANGNMLNGTDTVSESSVLSQYGDAVTSMGTKTHTIGFMHGISDNFMISAMSGLMTGKMGHKLSSGEIENDRAFGMTDTVVAGSYIALDNALKITGGLSVPTGSVHINGSDGDREGYDMQTGSGSFEFLPSIAYTRNIESYSFGAQADASIKLNNNTNNYRFGNFFNANIWAAKKVNSIFSISSRLNYFTSAAISGIDQAHINPDCICDVAKNVGGDRASLFIGGNIFVPGMKDFKITIEAGKPFYQNTNGPQIQQNFMFLIGIQKSF